MPIRPKPAASPLAKNGPGHLGLERSLFSMLPPTMLDRAKAPRPQAMIFTLWGDYVSHHGGQIWVGSVIRLVAEFGVSELALRSVLARMSRSGWLQATRERNRSYYRLTRRGQAVIDEGTARIFRPRREPWDGQWQLVTYSIPEAQRDLRDAFRKRLSYMGFGTLTAGIWITPHDLRTEVDNLAGELGVRDCVDQFRGAYLDVQESQTEPVCGSARNMAARVWPLDQLAKDYADFSDTWHSVRDEVAGDGVSDARAFVLRFQLIYAYQGFFLQDPQLPPELLPADWPGRTAAACFEALHARLAPAANRFFDSVFQAGPPPVRGRRLARVAVT